MIVARHSGQDAEIQSQGCETADCRVYKIKTYSFNESVGVGFNGYHAAFLLFLSKSSALNPAKPISSRPMPATWHCETKVDSAS